MIHRQRLELEAADGVLMVNVGLDLLVHHAPADVLVNSVIGKAQIVLVGEAVQTVGEKAPALSP